MARNHYLTDVDIRDLEDMLFGVLIVSSSNYRGLKRIWFRLQNNDAAYILELNGTEVGRYHTMASVAEAYNDL